MGLFSRKKKNRVCVIGLDGVPYTLLKEMAGKGLIPSMEKLLQSGHLHQMKASLPEISAVSWTDFMTGTNPGTHGIFGFTDLWANSYKLRFPNYLSVKEKTFWDLLAEKGKRCIVINQPSTYPAKEIKGGAIVSGFVAIELAKSVRPLSYLASLERMKYMIDIDTMKARQDPDFLLSDLDKALASSRGALDLFWKEEWDFFEFVITGTDRIQHYLWNAYGDDANKYHKDFIGYYQKVDAFVGELVASFQKLTDGEEGLFLLSDHGFTGIEQEVHLNTWLQQEGLLAFEIPEATELKDISADSKAFVLDPNRVYLNLKGKFPLGTVDEADKKSLKEEISRRLLALEYNGRKVVRKVFDIDDIYSGPLTAKGPDLIVLSEYGFDLKGAVGKKKIFDRTELQGMHTWDDAFFWAKDDHGADLSISRLAKIIVNRFSEE